jgi:hypothetical protein
MGRVLRILTQELPPSIEALTLEPMQRGLPLASATFARSDIEAFENEVGGTAAALARVELSGAGPDAGLVEVPPARPRLSWALRPVVGLTLFDSENPLALSLGAELSASYRLRPNLVLSGALSQQLLDSNFNLLGRRDGERELEEPISDVPVVRSDFQLYGATAIRPGRLNSGALSPPRREPLHPRDRAISSGCMAASRPSSSGSQWSRAWALGVEINYVASATTRAPGLPRLRRRHRSASAYYDFRATASTAGWMRGATLRATGAPLRPRPRVRERLERRRLFHLTDIPFEDFGEGSFDKGIRVTIPFDLFIGRPTRREVRSTVNRYPRRRATALSGGRLYDV